MIDIVDAPKDIDIQPAEYIRLLGYPRGHVLEDRARELADWAADWYRQHGRPWVFAHEVQEIATGGNQLVVSGTPFTSPQLVKTLTDAGAHSAVIVAVGAGCELEQEAHQRWLDGKPDEYFFLESYGSAVVEHLVTMTGARLCAWADDLGAAVLPHYSPGYPDWDVSEQPRLLELLRRIASPNGAVPLEVLESGMLRPKKSLLALFGVTRHVDRVRRLTSLIPCESCSFAPCQYRRAPYRRAAIGASPELSGLGADSTVDERADPTPEERPPLSPQAKYSVNERALRRWAAERLTLDHRKDGSIEATFRYDGTTCTNMGRPIAFHYRVHLASAAAGYLIIDERCAPAPGDQGHTLMCAYLDGADRLMKAIDNERPLVGQPLNDVLEWSRSQASTGCYCDTDSRTHKWGLVLETIHYALARGLTAGGGQGTKETRS